MPRKVKLYKREWEAIRTIKASLVNDVGQRPKLFALSRQYGLNREKINFGFHKLTGQSYYQYFMDVKMEEAKRLLIETEETIAVIAERVGYTEPGNFSSAFKDKFGISPLPYRIAMEQKDEEE